MLDATIALLSLNVSCYHIHTIQAFSVVYCPTGSMIRLLCAALVRIVQLGSLSRPLQSRNSSAQKPRLNK